ncbi:hypothetical protein D9619_011175 [Psilocybe cf. subviscida]|uniref:Uncharacterized protein n=1 Tax=Psilocybe cf. subviscida TaxID=2480587 RepID=A0A8H5BJE0_9AGAR|nr:hypothetical protein D9619_011175 [Psilocybe cf. subviscida]
MRFTSLRSCSITTCAMVALYGASAVMNALNEISIVSADGNALDHSAQEFTRLKESLNAALAVHDASKKLNEDLLETATTIRRLSPSERLEIVKAGTAAATVAREAGYAVERRLEGLVRTDEAGELITIDFHIFFQALPLFDGAVNGVPVDPYHQPPPVDMV